MKKVTVFSIILLLLLSCHESKDTHSTSELATFNRNVGQRITPEDAQRWVERHKKKQGSSKLQTPPSINEEALRLTLQSSAEVVGISFHRAINESGTVHLLIVPVKEGQPMWMAERILDANDNSLIDNKTAESWANQYRVENPNGAWSHFFGIHVFEDSFDTIDLIDAENDNEETQLLLYIWRSSGAEKNGRINEAHLEIFDHGQVCPPYCTTSDDSSN